MQVSAEVRWFWRGEVPPAVDRWFKGGPFAPGGGKTRLDVYLRDPAQKELGIKQRGNNPGVEIKGLVAQMPPSAFGKITATLEIWSKWTSTAIDPGSGSWIRTRKTRWLRKLDAESAQLREIALDENEAPADPKTPLPQIGCNVELTNVALDQGATWWTLGYEAFGPYGAVETTLRRAVEETGGTTLDVAGGAEMSYPVWLASIARGA